MSILERQEPPGPTQVILEKANEATGLFRLTDRLYRARTDADVYDAALDAIVDILGCARASVLLFDDNGVMQFVAARGLSAEYRGKLTGHTPWRPGERDPHPIFVSDIDATNEADWVKATVRNENIRALAFVPLMVQGGVIGKFMTYHEDRRRFDRHEMDMAVMIARQIGFSIERSRAEIAHRVAEARREFLVAELNHRVKNTLSVVQAIANQTFRATAQTERLAFEGRLQALARSHDVLTKSDWSNVSLHDLAATATQEAEEERVVLSGPHVLLRPGQTVALSMVLHELFTNALKYGALSNGEGRLKVQWTVRPTEPSLELEWSEDGGPPVKPPARSGFGSTLVRRMVKSELDGDVTLEFRPSGLLCSITARLTGVADPSV